MSWHIYILEIFDPPYALMILSASIWLLFDDRNFAPLFTRPNEEELVFIAFLITL